MLDGGITDRPGVEGLPAGGRVLYHHLATRSPWRRKGSASMEIPPRVDLTALVIDALPRVGPFRLEEGPKAFAAAREAAKRALDRSIDAGVVHVA